MKESYLCSKKIVEKFLTIFLALVLILSSITPILAVDQVTGGSWKIKLGPSDGKTFIENPQDEDYRMLTGKYYTILTALEVSGTDIHVDHPYGKVKIEKSEYLEKPVFTDPEEGSSTRVVYTEDDDYWYAKYEMDEINGGTKEGYPIRLAFKRNVTPNNVKVNIEYGIYDSQGNAIKVSGLTNPVRNTYISKASDDYTALMYLHRTPNRDKWTYNQSKPDINRPGVSDEEPYVLNTIFLKPNNPDPHGFGLYTPEKITYVVEAKKYNGKPCIDKVRGHYASKEAKFELDKSTGILTITMPRRDIERGKGTWVYSEFEAQFGGSPIGKFLDVTLKDVIFDKGTPLEKHIKIDKEHDTTQVKYNPLGAGVLFQKYRISKRDWRYVDGKFFTNDDGKIWGEGEGKMMSGFHILLKSKHKVSENNNIKFYKVEDYLDGDLKYLYYKDYQIKEENIEAYVAENKAPLVNYLRNIGYKLVGETYDGQQETIKEKVVLDEKVDINDTDTKYKKVIAVFPEDNPLLLDNTSVRISVNTGFTHKVGELSVENSKSYLIYNRAKGYYKIGSNEELKKSGSQDGFYVRPGAVYPDTLLRFASNGLGDYSASYVADKEKRKIKLRLLDRVIKRVPDSLYKVKDLKQTVILPEGVEYVETNTKGYTPEVIKNYKNSGKTAVIYSFGDMDAEQLKERYGDMGMAWNLIYFTVMPTLMMEPGENDFVSWISCSGPDYVRVDETYEKDKYDVNDNGNKDENIEISKAVLNYALPRKVRGRIKVSNNNETWTRAPLINQDIGSTDYYRINIINEYITPITNLEILDSLPYKGDHKMVALQDGSYPKRGVKQGFEGSTFTTPLKDSVESVPNNKEFLDKFDVFYSETSAGANIESVSGITNWKTADQVKDFKKIKNLKFVLKDGQEIGVFESVEAVLPIYVGDRTDLDTKDVAINSFAYSEGGGRYLEANETYIRPIKYFVEGTVFKDYPKTGTLENKKPLAGYKVDLVEADSKNPVPDQMGQSMEVTTGEDGHYKLPVYNRGKYRLKFTAKAGDKFTDINQPVNAEYSNLVNEKQSLVRSVIGMLRGADEKVAYSNAFTLDPKDISEIRNAGLIQKFEFNIEKLGAEDTPLKGVTFTLSKDGFEKTATTDDEGKINFNDLDAGKYKLTETSTPEKYKKLGSVYVIVAATGITIEKFEEDQDTIDHITQNGIDLQIKNDKVRDIEVTKKWVNTKEKPESVTVKLYADGEDTGKTLTLNADNDWKDKFQGVLMYKGTDEIQYTVKEDGEDENIVTINGDVYDVSYDGFNITNSKRKTITVKKIWEDSNGQLVSPTEESIKVKLEPTDKEVTLNAANNWTESFKNLPSNVEYNVVEDKEGLNYSYDTKIENKNGVYEITNVATKNIKVTKEWKDADRAKLPKAGIRVKLLANGKEVEELTLKPDTWSGTFENVPVFSGDNEIKYTIKEVGEKNNKIVLNDVEYAVTYDGFKITNTAKISVTVTKTWEGGKEEATVVELKDGEDTVAEKTLNEDNNWKAEFTNLDKNKTYTVHEVGEEDGYATIGGNLYKVEYDGYNITNKARINLPVEKKWVGVTKAPVDSIKVKLYADGEATDKEVTLSKENSWKATFEKLEKGKKYTVKEEGEAGNYLQIDGKWYKVKYSLDKEKGFVVTNTKPKDIGVLEPAKRTVKVVKKWIDVDGETVKAPVDSITVKLLANDKPTDKTITLDKRNNWEDSFTDLPTEVDGVKQVYTVKEEAKETGNLTYSPEYKKTKTGYEIVNTVKRKIKVSKQWKESEGNTIPAEADSVTVELRGNGKTKEQILNADNNWEATFEDLKPEVEYKVKEKNELGGYIKLNEKWYHVEYSGNMSKGFVVTNKKPVEWTPITPIAKRKITVTKKWLNSDGEVLNETPESVTVKLYADGEVTDKELVLSSENNWTGKFENLENTKDGKKIEYTVKESGEVGNLAQFDQKWYKVSYSGTMKEGLVVTNKAKKEWTPIEPIAKRSLIVSKKWLDSDGNELKETPESVTVKLLADNKETGKKLTLTKTDNWTGKFKNLDNTKNGNEIAYTVVEEGEIGGLAQFNQKWYEVSYSGDMKEGLVVTNKAKKEWTPLEPIATREITVTKKWEDSKGNPLTPTVKSIKIKLIADGKTTGKELILNAKNNWTGKFKALVEPEKEEPKVEEKEKAIKTEPKAKEEPKAEETKTAEPKVEEKKEEAKVEEPATEESKTEEPKTEELKTEEPKEEETKTEESKEEESKTEETTEKEEPKQEKPGVMYTVVEVGEVGGSIELDKKQYEVSYTGNMAEGFVVINKAKEVEKPSTGGGGSSSGGRHHRRRSGGTSTAWADNKKEEEKKEEDKKEEPSKVDPTPTPVVTPNPTPTPKPIKDDSKKETVSKSSNSNNNANKPSNKKRSSYRSYGRLAQTGELRGHNTLIGTVLLVVGTLMLIGIKKKHS